MVSKWLLTYMLHIDNALELRTYLYIDGGITWGYNPLNDANL